MTEKLNDVSMEILAEATDWLYDEEDDIDDILFDMDYDGYFDDSDELCLEPEEDTDWPDHGEEKLRWTLQDIAEELIAGLTNAEESLRI